jgi:hypothetical protein
LQPGEHSQVRVIIFQGPNTGMGHRKSHEGKDVKKPQTTRAASTAKAKRLSFQLPLTQEGERYPTSAAELVSSLTGLSRYHGPVTVARAGNGSTIHRLVIEVSSATNQHLWALHPLSVA